MGNDPRTQILGIQLHLEIHRKAPDSLPDSDSQNGLNGSCHHVVLRAFGVLALIFCRTRGRTVWNSVTVLVIIPFASRFFTASMNLWDRS